MWRSAFLTLLGLTACYRTCTLVDFEQGLLVRLERQGGDPMPPGRYEALLVADAAAVTVAWTEPEGRPTERVTTLSDGRILSITTPFVWEFRRGLLLVVSDRDGDVGGPKNLAITLSIDGTVVGQASYAPRYTIREPNGEGCGVQVFAEETLAIAR